VKEGSEHHLLVIRLSALGDVAMCVPAILAFLKNYPEWRISVVTKKPFSVLFEQIPGVEVFIADTRGRHKGLRGLWRLSRELRALQPARIADLHNVLRTRLVGLFLIASGIPLRRLDKGRAEKRGLTAARKKNWAPLKSTHQRYADVFRALGLPFEFTDRDVLPREPWPASLKALQPSEGLRKIGIAPFAAHSGKCYPEQLMKEVIDLLDKNDTCRLFLFGGGTSESERLARWESQCRHCVSVAGKGSLSEELALISNLDLMVSMDSGNGHLAAMYGVPVITLWGVTHPYCGFAPFGQPESHGLLSDRQKYPRIPTSVYGNKVPPGYDKSMETIPPDRVYGLIQEILAEIQGNQARTTGESDRK
jgi:ADP-heptose:LPS heptosyltransferase